MANFKDVIDTLDKAADGFDSIANAEQKKIYEEVITLAKDLETNIFGKVKQTITNLKRLNQIKAKLAALSKDKEWVAGISQFVKYFDILQRQQNAYFAENFHKTIGESAKKRNEMMKQIAVNNTIEALMGDGLKANVTDKLNDILLRGVTSGAKWADLQQELRDHLMGKEGGQGAFARYATTYATTALSQYTGQNNQMMTKDLGLEWFMYVGSNIETTREFCEVLTKKKWIHKSEIPTILQGKIEMPDGEIVEVAIYEKTGLPKGMIADTTPENFQCNCGGWNCRHQLIPVADAVVPSDVRARFKQIRPSAPKQGVKLGRAQEREAHIMYENSEPPTMSELQIENVITISKLMGIGKTPKAMTFNEADNGASNRTRNRDNCASCVLVHEARLRGLDVTSNPYQGETMELLAQRFQEAWINPKTGKVPQITEIRGANLYEKLDKQTQAAGRYHIGYNTIYDTGHVITAERFKNGKIIFYDPQRNEFPNLKEDREIESFEILKVDKLLLNGEILNSVASW